MVGVYKPWNLGFCVPTITPLVKLIDAVEKIFVLNYFWDTKTTRVNVGIKHEQLHRTKLRYLPLPRIPALRVVYHALLLQMACVDRVVMKQLSYATFVCKSNEWWGNVHSIINDWVMKIQSWGNWTVNSV